MDQAPNLNKKNTTENKETLKRRILVAEDELIPRISLVGMLQAGGYDVDEVEDGQFLVDAVLKGNKKYDLVITDQNMPNMKGLDALEKIRADERFTDLPIIVNSSENDELEEKIKSLNAQCIEKGVNQSVLLEKIKRIFEPSQE